MIVGQAGSRGPYKEVPDTLRLPLLAPPYFSRYELAIWTNLVLTSIRLVLFLFGIFLIVELFHDNPLIGNISKLLSYNLQAGDSFFSFFFYLKFIQFTLSSVSLANLVTICENIYQ